MKNVLYGIGSLICLILIGLVLNYTIKELNQNTDGVKNKTETEESPPNIPTPEINTIYQETEEVNEQLTDADPGPSQKLADTDITTPEAIPRQEIPDVSAETVKSGSTEKSFEFKDVGLFSSVYEKYRPGIAEDSYRVEELPWGKKYVESSSSNFLDDELIFWNYLNEGNYLNWIFPQVKNEGKTVFFYRENAMMEFDHPSIINKTVPFAGMANPGYQPLIPIEDNSDFWFYFLPDESRQLLLLYLEKELALQQINSKAAKKASTQFKKIKASFLKKSNPGKAKTDLASAGLTEKGGSGAFRIFQKEIKTLKKREEAFNYNSSLLDKLNVEIKKLEGIKRQWSKVYGKAANQEVATLLNQSIEGEKIKYLNEESCQRPGCTPLFA